MAKYLNDVTLTYFWNRLKNYFVKQEAGKGLSTNDLTNELKSSYDNVITKVNGLIASGGEPNVIEKVAVNGSDLTPDGQKRVNVVVPTKLSALTNDSGFQTGAQVQASITSAVSNITGIKFQVAANLPAAGENGVIYLIAHEHGDKDAYDEYAWIGTKFEKLGSTDIDLSGYVKKSDLVAITTAEIDTMVGA